MQLECTYRIQIVSDVEIFLSIQLSETSAGIGCREPGMIVWRADVIKLEQKSRFHLWVDKTLHDGRLDSATHLRREIATLNDMVNIIESSDSWSNTMARISSVNGKGTVGIW